MIKIKTRFFLISRWEWFSGRSGHPRFGGVGGFCIPLYEGYADQFLITFSINLSLSKTSFFILQFWA